MDDKGKPRSPPMIESGMLVETRANDVWLIYKARRQGRGQFIRWKRLPGRGWFCGVCAGLAYRFGMRPWKVRLAFVLASLILAFLPAVPYLLYATFVPVRKRMPKDFDTRTRSNRAFSLDPG